MKLDLIFNTGKNIEYQTNLKLNLSHRDYLCKIMNISVKVDRFEPLSKADISVKNSNNEIPINRFGTLDQLFLYFDKPLDMVIHHHTVILPGFHHIEIIIEYLRYDPLKNEYHDIVYYHYSKFHIDD